MVSLIPFLAKSEFYLSAANFEIQGDARENFRQELIKAGFEPPQIIELENRIITEGRDVSLRLTKVEK